MSNLSPQRTWYLYALTQALYQKLIRGSARHYREGRREKRQTDLVAYRGLDRTAERRRRVERGNEERRDIMCVL